MSHLELEDVYIAKQKAFPSRPSAAMAKGAAKVQGRPERFTNLLSMLAEVYSAPLSHAGGWQALYIALVYLALIPGYREETLKPGIIPGNPVYLAGMVMAHP